MKNYYTVVFGKKAGFIYSNEIHSMKNYWDDLYPNPNDWIEIYL